MKILIADDHAVVRQGLRAILAEEFPTARFGEAEDTPGVLQQAAQEDWDIVILDISMPGRGGLDALHELKRRQPRLPVLVLSIHPPDQFAVRCLRAGAAGYLTKESVPEELVEAVNKALGGGSYVSAAVAERLATYLQVAPEGPVHEVLSDREFQILCMIASGKTVGQIADELSLSVSAVSTYRRRMLDKMGMETNAELTRYAVEKGLLD